MQWGKDKTPNSQTFDPNQPYSPQSTPGSAYPGTPSTYFPQYGGKLCRKESSASTRSPLANLLAAGQYTGQQGNYGGHQAQSPAGYAPQQGQQGQQQQGQQQAPYNGPQSAGGYGRGQQAQSQQQQWNQGTPNQGFNNGFNGGYQA